MAKLSDLSLDELYDRPKITPATLKAIKMKEDFSSVKVKYCDKVCTAPCYMKFPEDVTLEHTRSDIMIIHAHHAMDDGWKEGQAVEAVNKRIIDHTMREVIGRRKIDYGSFYALKCQPIPANQEQRSEAEFGKKPFPDNPKLKATDIQKCAVYLMEEIKSVKPRVIISTSTDVTRALGLKSSNYKNRGYIEMLEIGDMQVPVILTLHPSVTTMIRQNASGQMWGPDYLEVIRRDFRKAVDIVTGDVTVKSLQDAFKRIEERDQIIVTRSLDEVREWTERIGEMSGKRSIVSWDTETTGLDPWANDARFLMHQFGFRRDDGDVQAVVFPLWHRNNNFYDADKAWELIEPLLKDENLFKVAHNAAFDLKYTRVTRGVEVKGLVADTMLLLHSINSGIQGNYSLKTAVWDFLVNSGLGGYEEELDKEFQERMAAILEEEKQREKEALAAEKAAAKEAAKAESPPKKKAAAKRKAPAKKKAVAKKKPVKEKEEESTSSIEVVKPEEGSQKLPYVVLKRSEGE